MSARHVFLNGSMQPPREGRLQAFQQAASALRGYGYAVTNPVELGLDDPLGKHSGLRSEIEALLKCDTMALLPGWNTSGDAKLLVNIAARLGMPLYGVKALMKEDAPR